MAFQPGQVEIVLQRARVRVERPLGLTGVGARVAAKAEFGATSPAPAGVRIARRERIMAMLL
jgi:hypothetical protein